MKSPGILLASMLLAGFCHAQDRMAAHPPPIVQDSTRYGWADVLRVDPVYEAASDAVDGDQANPAAPADCDDPPPQARVQDQADNRVAGSVIGALIGGVIGHAFGSGDGKKATTAAGAVAGGVAGNRIAAAHDGVANERAQQADVERDAVSASLRDCRDAHATRRPNKSERHIVGYDVEYRYKGEIYMVRLPFDPGDRMRVKVTVVPVE